MTTGLSTLLTHQGRLFSKQQEPYVNVQKVLQFLRNFRLNASNKHFSKPAMEFSNTYLLY